MLTLSVEDGERIRVGEAWIIVRRDPRSRSPQSKKRLQILVDAPLSVRVDREAIYLAKERGPAVTMK